jgi:hypothetical protein
MCKINYSLAQHEHFSIDNGKQRTTIRRRWKIYFCRQLSQMIEIRFVLYFLHVIKIPESISVGQ